MYGVILWVRDGVATIPLLLLFALVTMNWWINVIVAPSIFVLRRPILSAIRRKRASSSFGGAVILVSGVEKIVTSQEDLLVLSLSFPPISSNLLYLLDNLSKVLSSSGPCSWSRVLFDLQEDLSFHEHPVRFLVEVERPTRNISFKFLKCNGCTIPIKKQLVPLPFLIFFFLESRGAIPWRGGVCSVPRVDIGCSCSSWVACLLEVEPRGEVSC